ncbi:carbon-nitrogen hydrolase family protein [Maritimibacter sp. UBA3975]|uniref:carbon-nitrogen hydrolase family protein n=1 Tax=Maritimibacter sp. UBA3975 TaxID=1946833 RepID=UPI000C094EF4|nr:carbon-nitrogen hydrolase family protein [Maritimibacter sp. UBA3975]MAM59877.1 amidohydrolase [Maritimibacter sp.]
MKIAAACYPVDGPDSWAGWEDKAEAWVADAGADIAVFPEYGAMELAAITGARGLSAEMRAVSEALPRAWDHWARLATRYDIHILAPSGPVFDGDAPVNRAMFLAPSGKRQAHDKRVRTPWERDPMGCAPGGAPVLMDTTLGRVGVQICYDCEFPLATRAMAEAGLDVLLVPSQTEAMAGFSRVRTGARARALEAQCVVAHAPTQGQAAWSEVVDENTGAAGIYVPSDHGLPETGILAQGAMNTPGWTRVELDVARLQTVRTAGGVRTRTDWPEQFGADAVSIPPIPLVSLR